jgi:hypothetical protein
MRAVCAVSELMLIRVVKHARSLQLYASFNQITEFPAELTVLPQLLNLDLSHNKYHNPSSFVALECSAAERWL